MKKERNFYLKLTNVYRALEIIDSLPHATVGNKYLGTGSALHRITSEDVFAVISSPHYNASAMDGIATVARLTYGASESNPVVIDRSEYRPIDTGQPIPDGYDTVIPEEYIEYDDNGNAVIRQSFYPWDNIRIIGENIVKGDLLIPENSMIDEKAIPLLISGGCWKVKVKERLKVLVIPTGSEVISPSREDPSFLEPENLKDGMVIDYDSGLLSSILTGYYCDVEINEVVKDHPRQLEQVIKKSIDNYSFICIIAGSSAGRKDFTVDALKSMGDVLIHGINMMPGKPFLVSKVKNRVVFGIPGFPASAYFVTTIFLKRYIENVLGFKFIERKLEAHLSQNTPSKLGYHEPIRVSISNLYGKLKAVPLKRGASVFKSIYDSDGYFIIPSNSEGVKSGSTVNVVITDNNLVPEKRILFIGSNDLSIDIIKSLASKIAPDFRIVSINRGSMGGLSSLKNEESHFSPTHLLDPDTGTYNIRYIKQIFKTKRISLLGLAEREQGIIVQKGNPKGIKSIKDLPGIKFVNRQKGSGTRILFDYLLDKNGIKTSDIDGYSIELYTHTAICNFIKKGYADAGIGTLSAANVFDLDFIPIAKEEYEVAFYRDFMDDERFKLVYQLVQSKEFKTHLARIGGYDFNITGRLRNV